MNTFARLALASLLATTSTTAYAQTGPSVADPAPIQDQPPADTLAQEQEAEDDTVIVTGTRTPKAIDKIPGAITVITPAEVQRTLALTEDSTAVLARSVPGYSESSQALNSIGETLRGRTALYLFDGIPQSTPLRDGSRNATFTDMSNIERIEVINGPSAAEGIGAAGGVVNYISKRATLPGTHFGVSGRIGSQFEDDSTVWKIGGTLAHKGNGFDVFVAGSYLDRGITYDARGRRIGLSASTSVADSTSRNAFLKLGTDFGENDEQRLEGTASYFKLASKGNYRYVMGNRNTGLSDTSEPGPPVDTNGRSLAGTEFNEFFQYALTYTNKDLFGGTLIATAYTARQAMRFPGDTSIDRQDPRIAPLGTLVDQSEIRSYKRGLRTSFTREDFLIDDLELRIGIDAVRDQTEQRLALTDRVWVPPIKYTSFGPYIQLSYDIGPVTVAGGWRHEQGESTVDDYTTTFFRNSVFVQGGTIEYKNDLFNAGAIWRIGGGLSVFGAYSEGFTLPNFGIPLRNVNIPNRSVESLLSDLQAVVFENKEAGFNWRGKWGSVGASVYESKSALGSTFGIDPVTRDFVLNRRPITIRGLDVTVEVRPVSTVKISGLFAHTDGKTTAANNITSPIDVQLGIINVSPDKANLFIDWDIVPEARVTFGATKVFDNAINQGRAGAERTEGYTLFDLTATYKADGVGTFSLGAENLFNKFYFLTFSQIDFFQNYFAGRGRTVSLSLRRDF